MESILKVIDIKKSFKLENTNKKVLDGISLDIKKGELAAVIGESGSGKTTLCKIIIGLEGQDAGTILFNNNEVKKINTRSFEEAADIQYIFQDPYAAIDGESTVLKALEEPLKLCNRNKREALSIEEALKHVKLDEKTYLNKKVKTLSGGQRQRLAIARALITKPSLIIADECTSMLDDVSSKEILEIFKELNEKTSLSFLIVTHNIKIILGLCSEIYVMNNGKIIEKGKTEEIVASPKAAYTKAWINSMRRIEGDFLNGENSLC